MNTFQLYTAQIEAAVAAIPEELQVKYPNHIFEPERIAIACELAAKEYYKLLPTLSTDQMEALPGTILDWLPGEGYTLDPVAGFWNHIDGIMLNLKYKNIVPRLTSANITWSLEEIDPRGLSLYAPLGTLKSWGRGPFTYDFIKQHILDDPKQRRINQQDSDSHAIDTKLSRDDFPIIVLRQQNGNLQLLDGNRRCMRAYLQDKPTIAAWVGTVVDTPVLRDHWVNTGYLCRMLSNYQQQPSLQAKEALRVQLQDILASSQIAQLHFIDPCCRYYPFAAKLMEGV